jgi:hypothetical protein
MPHPLARGGRLLLPFLLISTPAFGTFAQGASMESANGEQRRAAQKTFEAGDDLFEHGRYEEAMTAFRASQALVASPNSRLMIGRCLRELGRRAEAYIEFEATAQEAEQNGRYAETLAAASAERDAMKAQIAFLVVDAAAEPGVEGFRIGERRYSSEHFGKPIPLDPGRVEIVTIVNGADGRTATLEAEAGKTYPLPTGSEASELPAATPAPATPTKSPATAVVATTDSGSGLRTAAWISAGVGVAGVAGFAIFGMMSKSQYESLEKECPGGRCGPDRQEDIDSGERNQLFANIGLAVGVVGIGVGATLFVLSSGSDEQEHGRVTLGPAGVAYRGSF